MEPVDKDHCPPKGLFASTDRVNFPVILPTHKTCNHKWHGLDDLLGILTDALHTRKKSQDTNVTKRLESYLLPFNGKDAATVNNVPLAEIALRIVRGMHALLYKQYLPAGTRTSVHVPLPEAKIDTGEIIQPLDQAFVFSAEVRRALLTDSADQVNAYNGNFKYACVWNHLDGGIPFCMYAFDIYAFHTLSPKVTNFPKCFVGMYIPTIVPTNAAWASSIKFNMSRAEMLDPWLRT